MAARVSYQDHRSRSRQSAPTG